MVMTVFNRLDEMTSCKDIDSLCRSFERHICYYGFDRYALAFNKESHGPTDNPVVLATYEKNWVDYYFENNYDRIDPVFLKTKTQITPFLWSDIWHGTELSKVQTKLFNEAKDYGIAYGLGIPIKMMGRDNALLSLVSSACRPKEVEDIFSHYINEIVLLATYFLQIADHILLASDLLQRKNPGNIITDRESEVLHWIAHGKTDWEICNILGISIHTVREHSKSIYSKLNVCNRSQAAVVGTLTGIIHIKK